MDDKELFAVVVSTSNKGDRKIVRDECILAKNLEPGSAYKVYIGMTELDNKPNKVERVKTRGAELKPPGVYWCKLVSMHGNAHT